MKSIKGWRSIALIGIVGLAAVVLATSLGGDRNPAAAQDLLITAQELRDTQAANGILVLDARSAEDFALGAIPGAVSLSTEVLNRIVVLDDGTEVPRIVKEADDIRAPLREAGVRSGAPVVVYDNGAETSATRIFWVLDYYGHENVRVLDGGLAAWKAAGGELSTSATTVSVGDFDPRPQPDRLADFDYVQQAMFSDTVMVCNALSADSYAKGSIEGSTNLHGSALFDDGEVPYFRGGDVLVELLSAVGYEDGQEFLSFCGSGYFASINYFAARLIGLERVRMYDGSLLDWNARGGALLPSGGRA